MPSEAKKLPIVHLPHSVLKKKAREVPLSEIESSRVRELIRDMRSTLAAATDGVGLAAPQVGVGLRVFLVSEEASVIDTASGIHVLPGADDTKVKNAHRVWEYTAFVNPVLKKQSRKKIAMTEGCLSVPGKFGVVMRPEKVSLEWYDLHGKKHSRGFSKFFARVIQHELDHLDGLLIADRTKLIAVPDRSR